MEQTTRVTVHPGIQVPPPSMGCFICRGQNGTKHFETFAIEMLYPTVDTRLCSHQMTCYFILNIKKKKKTGFSLVQTFYKGKFPFGALVKVELH